MIDGVVKQVPMTVALLMAREVKQRWAGDLQSDPRIPPLAPSTVKKKGHDKILFRHGLFLQSVTAEERADGEAAVTTGDERAVALFFGVPEKHLPPRDMFAAAIGDALDEGKDFQAVNAMLDAAEKEWCGR